MRVEGGLRILSPFDGILSHAEFLLLASICRIGNSISHQFLPTIDIGVNVSHTRALALDSRFDSRVYAPIAKRSNERLIYEFGEVAKRAGVSIDTLRYYEKVRLLPRTSRPEYIEKVCFIKQAQELGFSTIR